MMSLYQVVYLMSSFGMHARCTVLRGVQTGGHAHRYVAMGQCGTLQWQTDCLMTAIAVLVP